MPTLSPAHPPPSRRSPAAVHLRWPLLVLAGLALALFFFRGATRTVAPGLRDFAPPYAGARLFWQGADPYAPDAVRRELSRAGAGLDEAPPALYPPGAFLALAPFAVLPAEPAKLLFVAASVAAWLFGLVAWSRLVGAAGPGLVAVILVALACAPLHTAMMVANPAIGAAASLLLGTALWRGGRSVAALTLLLLALLLKPQLGLLAVPWLWLDGARRVAVRLSVAALLLHALAFTRLGVAAPSFLASWRGNFAAEAGEGSISAAHQLSFHRIDPSALFQSLFARELPVAVSLALAAGLATWLLRDRLRRPPQSAAASLEILAVGAVCALLVGYHRAYDALLLAPLWLRFAASPAWPATRTARVGFAIVGLLWVLPGGGFWWMLGRRLPESLEALAAHPLWTLGLQRHQAWLLVATVPLLLLFRPSAAPCSPSSS